MKEGRPSGSAIFAAISRAAHLILDGEPKIFQDDFALAFSGMQNEVELRTALEALHTEFGQQTTPELAKALLLSFRGFAVMRHRYTEDELTKALERCVSQYVILGAGLDSFAYRRLDLENKLIVFEVDQPAIQQWKKARLRELDISPHRNLTFVPVDFEKQILMDELRAHGYRKDAPAFFSWLGVTMYLTEAAVYQTLREVVVAAPGSEIVFEYVLPDSLLDDGERRIAALGRANTNEPNLSHFDPVSLAKRLKEIGFSEVWDFGTKEANTLYFNGRTDELSASVLDGLYASTIKLMPLMKARV